MKRSCQKEEVISIAEGSIFRCVCGTYYVRFGLMTLCFSALEFEKIARLFKMSLGMIAAKRSQKAEPEPLWEAVCAKIAS